MVSTVGAGMISATALMTLGYFRLATN